MKRQPQGSSTSPKVAGTPRSPATRGTPRGRDGHKDRALMCMQDMCDFVRRHGRLPGQHIGVTENNLYHRWHKFKDKSISEKAKHQRSELMQLIADASTLAECERSIRSNHEKWCDDHLPPGRLQHPVRPTLCSLAGGANPYPGMSNLGNTCYLNAPLQCLLHCGAARAAMLTPTQHVVEEQSIQQALRALVSACMNEEARKASFRFNSIGFFLRQDISHISVISMFLLLLVLGYWQPYLL